MHKVDYSGVWVYCEIKNSMPISVVFELLGAGRSLATKLNTKLSAVLIGNDLDEAVKSVAAYGADKVFLVENKVLSSFNDDLYSKILIQIFNMYKPEIVLFGATAYGRSLAPRIASHLNTGLTADCTSLDIDPVSGLLIQTRPAFGGNLMATIICAENRPQMCTVRPRVMKSLMPDNSKDYELIKPTVTIPTKTNLEILEIVNYANTSKNLSDADIIVAAGKGMGNSDNIKLIEELAVLLGGAVGASRAAVDSGWLNYSNQIGQTGKTVNPKIYIAVGISGSVQHLAGMSSSDYIIAINKDPAAPIFQVASIGIVGDALDILPDLIKEIKLRKAKSTSLL